MKKMHFLSIVVLIFCTILALCSSCGHQAVVSKETAAADSCWPSASAASEEVSTLSVQLSAPPKTKETLESCRYRDDIVSDGNLLSYELQETMQDCCEKYDVPYALLLAIAETESRFEPDAVSATHDYGLMQINQCNHEWLLEMGIDPKTPSGNVESGAYIISQHLQSYGEPELALMAYNCGPSGAKKLWDSGIYQSDYSKKVMASFERWENVLKTPSFAIVNNDYEEE